MLGIAGGYPKYPQFAIVQHSIRGLSTALSSVADGALGFWKALGEVWPTTREQRCWVGSLKKWSPAAVIQGVKFTDGIEVVAKPATPQAQAAA